MSEPDENKLIAQRREKLTAIRGHAAEFHGSAFPNDFRREHLAAELRAHYGDKTAEEMAETPVRVSVAGRMMAKRVMGKASFARLQDMSDWVQLFVQRDAIGEDEYKAFKGLDVGDILGAEGVLFITRTGELSVKVDRLRLLTKSLRPLPETRSRPIPCSRLRSASWAAASPASAASLARAPVA